MENKINILIIYTDTLGGVGFYRSKQPHIQIAQMFPNEFTITEMTRPDFTNLSVFDKFQIIHFHKGVFYETEELQKTFTDALKYFKEKGIVTVMDIDDNWKLGSQHPNYKMNIYSRRTDGKVDLEEATKTNFSLVDYVTTTTDLFADLIRPFNKNVYVFPNAIDPTDSRFIVKKEPCNKLRIGFIMGSTHEADLATMDGFTGKLSQDVLDKIELVLCGFDNRGSITVFAADGSKQVRPIRPQENVWYRYEKMVTNNYKIVSPQYKQFLEQFIPDSVYPFAEQEGYKRCWTKDMNHYYQHYKEIDVLLAPLKSNDFNYVKSELKAIECCFSHTAFVGSNFGPYTIGLKNIFKKGGEVDTDGNAILIDENRAHKDWAKAIEKLVKHPEYVKMLQDNLYRDFHEKYDLSTVARNRAEFYREIIKK